MVPNWQDLNSPDYGTVNKGNDLFIAVCLCSNTPEHLRFHNSWNSLMQVVDKITKTESSLFGSLTVMIENHCTTIRITFNYAFEEGDGGRCSKPLIKQVGDSRLEACYKSVVAFVKWYNNQTKPK